MSRDALRKASPERYAADLLRRIHNRQWFVQYVPHPYKAEDTRHLAEDERAVIDRILREYREKGTRWMKLWGLLNDLGYKKYPGEHVSVTRPRRQQLLALVQRLIKEKKLVRHRRAFITVADWLLA